jgi:hypothetical protein
VIPTQVWSLDMLGTWTSLVTGNSSPTTEARTHNMANELRKQQASLRSNPNPDPNGVRVFR